MDLYRVRFGYNLRVCAVLETFVEEILLLPQNGHDFFEDLRNRTVIPHAGHVEEIEGCPRAQRRDRGETPNALRDNA